MLHHLYKPNKTVLDKDTEITYKCLIVYYFLSLPLPGNCQYPTLGTTNLHLDISDAVNVMVHVAIPKGDPDANVTQEDLQNGE